jgi:CBS domain-containing protein
VEVERRRRHPAPREVAMKSVREVMCPVLDVLHTTDSVADAAGYLATHEDDSVPFCQADGRLAGTVSNRDIVAKVVARGLDPRRVQLGTLVEVGEPVTLDVNASVDDAVAVMSRARQGRLPVTADARVVGFVTQRDMARTLAFRPSFGDE